MNSQFLMFLGVETNCFVSDILSKLSLLKLSQWCFAM